MTFFRKIEGRTRQDPDSDRERSSRFSARKSQLEGEIEMDRQGEERYSNFYEEIYRSFHEARSKINDPGRVNT